MVKLELYDTVGENITVDTVRTFLNANKTEEIEFDISSLGGDLATGLTIYDLIKAHPQKTKANIIGLTASAGTVIAMGCDEIEISDNALFLIHNGWKEVTGNIYDFQKAVADMAKMDAIMVKIYREKTGLADEKINDLMKASDWLSPAEAEQYGFVDRVLNSGVKIAANIMLAGAKNKINDLLLIKLEQKMNLFGKEKAKTPSVMNVLALTDNRQLVMNAEEVGTGVEVAPLGAMTLEDGEYELADGRKIMVAGGVITEVMEETPAEPEAAKTEEVVAAVSEVVAEAIKTVKAEMQAEFKAELAKISSKHTPPKGKGVETPKAKVDVVSNVEAIAAGIRKNIVESRKA